MSYFFNSKPLNKTLESCPRLLQILEPTNTEAFVCPYDGLLLSTGNRPADYFLKLVMPACYCDLRRLPKSRYYKYVLSYRYFIVQWDPVFKHCPYTMIYINPSVNQLSPAQILDILKFIVGDYQSVYVNTHDDKVDIYGFTPKDIVECLYVGHIKSASRRFESTYYIGSREGQFIRIYDKSSHLGIIGKQLVRIERRVRYKKKRRSLIADFLLYSRTDAFKHLLLVDLSSLKWSSKLGRRIRSFGTFVDAYRDLGKDEKELLRGSSAFSRPLLDLRQLFQSDLAIWMSHTPHLQQKLVLDRLGYQMTNFFKDVRLMYSRYSPSPISPLTVASHWKEYSNSF